MSLNREPPIAAPHPLLFLNLKLALLAIALIWSGGVAKAAPGKPDARVAEPREVERIPFTLLNGLIWVKVEAEVYGKKGKTREYDFVLDSGAGALVVNVDTARRLKLKTGAPLPVYGVGMQGMAYQLEGFRAKAGRLPLSEEAYVVSLKRSKREKNRVIHGMLGQDFFRDRIVQIDYTQRRLLVFPDGTSPRYRQGANRVPIRLHGDAMIVPIALNGSAKEWVRLDTGCVSALEWTGKGEFALIERPGKRSRKKTPPTYSADLSLGSEFLPAVAIGVHANPFFKGEAGLLGNGLLSRYGRVTIDGRSMELVLEQ